MAEDYDIVLILVGLALLAATVLPRLLAGRPLSEPIIVLGLGCAAFALPIGLPSPDPRLHGELTERVAELGVILALMGAGLKLDRPMGWRTWSSAWRLLAVTMPLTIAGVALLGWWLAGLVPASAVLLGAVLAPTDPVLASEVQVGQPQVGDEAQEEAEEEPEVRFALTAEAGLNDGLAFPFANAALVMVVYGSHPANWLGRWLLIELLYKIAAGALIGVVLGGILGRWIVGLKAPTSLAKAMIGLGAVAATLLAYGMAELVGGYGFIAVFVAAVSMRNYERHHTYHEVLHQTSEIVERTLTALILVLLGGALVRGVLDELTPAGVAVVLLLLFVIRPAAGMLGLLGSGRLDRRERAAVSFFGIRGIGSIYYLAHALGEESFVAGAELWSLVVFAVLVSVVVHGIAAAPVMSRLESST